MASKKVTVDTFAGEVKIMLDDYGEDVAECLEEILPKVAKMGKEMLNAQSPKKTGKYAKSWSVKNEKRRLDATSTIYSSKPGLPHLLEHGHLTRKGTHGGQRVHIAPVEEEINKEFEDELRRRIEKI